MSNPSARSVRLAFAAIAGPAMIVGIAAPAASAAELTPVAKYVDHTVSKSAQHVSAAVDDLGVKKGD